MATQDTIRRQFWLRLSALAGATICGVYFLGSVFALAVAYNQTERHFPLFITTEDFAKTIVAGVCFVCFGIAYAVLTRKTKAKSA